MGFLSRGWREAADLALLLQLLAQRSAHLAGAYPSSADLEEICGTAAGRAGLRLWERAGGQVVGFHLLDGDTLSFVTAPEVDFDALAETMVAQAVETLRALPEPPPVLCASCRAEDRRRAAFLEARGFTAQPVRTLHFSRSLLGEIEPPRLPEGFTIRPLRGEEEIDDWLALHAAAHGGGSLSAEYRRSMMRASGYRRDLDLVAAAPDGRLAGYVVCHIDEQENHLRGEQVGYTDPLATHPDYQRLGLAKALLLAGFARLKARGMARAQVSTWGENTAMIRAAESAGYRVYSTTVFYERAL